MSISNELGERYKKSLDLLKEAEECIPGQAQTFSKGWTQYPRGAAPIFAVKADGGYIWDADGHKYIDWPMALGPVLLGHNNTHVNAAIENQLNNGVAFSLPTEQEVALSKRLKNWFPYADAVRFGKNGSDVTSGAVRLARAYTSKDIILCCGYHGWQDWFIGTTTRNAGVPDATRSLTVPFPFNEIEVLEKLLHVHKGEVAAIILEPMGIIEPIPGYLQSVRDLATKHDAVLIFDECWTGFRLHLQGAFGHYGIAPDIACFGKALGNGAPISAIVGRGDIMKKFEEAFFSFTFGGDLIGIAAAQAVLDVLEREPVLERVEQIGRALMEGIGKLVTRHNLIDQIKVYGYPARHIIEFSGDGYDGMLAKSLFQQEGCAAGILTAGWHAPSYAHDVSHVDHTLDNYDKIFALIKDGLANRTLDEYLQGKIVEPVFRKP